MNISFHKSPLGLLLIASVPLAFGFAAVSSVFLSAFQPSVAPSAMLFLFGGLLVLVFLWTTVLPYFGRATKGLDLVRSNHDRHLAWLYLHTAYIASGYFNMVLVILALSFYFGEIGLATLQWIFNFGLSSASLVLYAWLVMKILGQNYETLRGDSFVGAAALARLSGNMFLSGKKPGMSYLLASLKMANAVFDLRGHRPAKLNDVYATVEGLIEDSDPPFEVLNKLARSLESLPKRSELPLAIETFLSSLGWPGGFETTRRRRSGYRLVSFTLSVALAVISFLAIFPEEARAFLAWAGGLLVTNLLAFLSASFILISLFLSLRTFTYIVPPRDYRKYMQAEAIHR